MFRQTDWPYWYHKKPFGSGHQVLKDRILGTYLECKGNLAKVFKKLDLTAFSYYNYVRLLGLKEQLVSMRQAMRGQVSRNKYSDEEAAPRATPTITAGPVASKVARRRA